MKRKRIAAIVIVAVLIIAVIVLLSGPGSGPLSFEKMKGGFFVLFTREVFETQNSGYIVSDGNEHQFVDQMLADGWVLHSSKNSVYTFERQGHIVEYKGRALWFGLIEYYLTG